MSTNRNIHSYMWFMTENLIQAYTIIIWIANKTMIFAACKNQSVLFLIFDIFYFARNNSANVHSTSDLHNKDISHISFPANECAYF